MAEPGPGQQADGSGGDARVEHYVSLFEAGHEERAYFGLIHDATGLLPALRRAFDAAQQPSRRGFLLEVASQARDAALFPLLLAGLEDPAKEVWSTALDGIVTYADHVDRRAAAIALGNAAGVVGVGEKAIWLREALDQVESGPGVR